VAPNARFTASRGLGFSTFAETASAYTFARQQNVDVHNNSWGYGCMVPAPSVVADAIRTAFEEGRGGLGMVILFASGNDYAECPLDISSLPTVISVGATNAADQRSSYSNWGEHLDVMAPSNADEEGPGLPQLVTTDNTDDAGYAEPGYNFDGFNNELGVADLSDPDYTQYFGGTSAACPVAAGVAALVISVNPELTATQVRLILEHTAEQVSPEEALYDGVTSRSNKYGYGRISAARAVEAASQSKTNGGLTWPDRVSDVRVSGDTLRWNNGAETKTTLIVRSDDVFQWIPEEGASYAVDSQAAPGVTVVFKDSDGEESYEFAGPDFGTAYFGIYAVNSVGRYSWGVGVSIDSDGNLDVTDAGPIDTGDGDPDAEDDDDQTGILPINETPKVSITVTPRDGVSPLPVQFQGNALTDSAIASTEWDFGDGSATVSTRDTTHTYTITDGRSHRYIAKFTVVDDEGDEGQRSIAIDVEPSEEGGDPGGGSGGTVVVVASSPAGGEEVTKGDAPLTITFTFDTSDLPGVFEGDVVWDLGDGTQAHALLIEHTYKNPGNYAVQATVFTCHATNGCATSANPAGTTYETVSPVKWIEVTEPAFAGPAPAEESDSEAVQAGGPSNLPTGGNAGGGACGLGMTSVLFGLFALPLMRRWMR
jgi:PKD repeat protein